MHTIEVSNATKPMSFALVRFIQARKSAEKRLEVEKKLVYRGVAYSK